MIWNFGQGDGELLPFHLVKLANKENCNNLQNNIDNLIASRELASRLTLPSWLPRYQNYINRCWVGWVGYNDSHWMPIYRKYRGGISELVGSHDSDLKTTWWTASAVRKIIKKQMEENFSDLSLSAVNQIYLKVVRDLMLMSCPPEALRPHPSDQKVKRMYIFQQVAQLGKKTFHVVTAGNKTVELIYFSETELSSSENRRLVRDLVRQTTRHLNILASKKGFVTRVLSKANVKFVKI